MLGVNRRKCLFHVCESDICISIRRIDHATSLVVSIKLPISIARNIVYEAKCDVGSDLSIVTADKRQRFNNNACHNNQYL